MKKQRSPYKSERRERKRHKAEKGMKVNGMGNRTRKSNDVGVAVIAHINGVDLKKAKAAKRKKYGKRSRNGSRKGK